MRFNFYRTGARNAQDIIDAWPSYVGSLKKVRNTILQFRRTCTEVQDLVYACGPSASRSPPSAKTIEALRGRVARKLGLSAEVAALSHPASPWKFALVRKVLQLAGDPDLHIADWLEHGTPVGIREEIKPAGLLPLISESPSITPEQLQDRAQWKHNHPSFDTPEGESFPAHLLLNELVDQGFAYIFTDASAAAEFLGTSPVPSPMGDVVKIKPDGSIKHRLIQDLRASAVNSASRVAERQVLPRFADHAADVAQFSSSGEGVGVFVIDYKNAFMTLPLASAEMPFNTTAAPHLVRRTRQPLLPNEPEQGSFLVWRVLGFGGHTNPLTYSRVASFAARSAQALLCAAPSSGGVAEARIQLYVDDPAITLRGTAAQQRLAVDVLLLWWLVLGIPLAWEKGSFSDGIAEHEWIGVRFSSPAPGLCRMTIPDQLRSALFVLAQKFIEPKRKTASLKEAYNLCGRAGRLAQVVPEVAPFVGQLQPHSLVVCTHTISVFAKLLPPEWLLAATVWPLLGCAPCCKTNCSTSATLFG